ncbi:MAG: hypothetical protein AABW86_01960 [Candidatus Micrarchaeota archaeon]
MVQAQVMEGQQKGWVRRNANTLAKLGAAAVLFAGIAGLASWGNKKAIEADVERERITGVLNNVMAEGLCRTNSGVRFRTKDGKTMDVSKGETILENGTLIAVEFGPKTLNGGQAVAFSGTSESAPSVTVSGGKPLAPCD